MNATRPARPPDAQAAAPPHSRTTLRRLPRAALLAIVLAALVGAALAALASPAQAAPQQPIMTLTRLSELLAASPSGTIPGCYFLTTDKGVDIATIKCTVDGVVPEAADDNGSLIMFDATDDPIIDAIGGIADGMSGSPLYVTDPANHTDELVGAVSYGSEFTKGGLGLATPIEHMMTLESAMSPDALRATARSVTLKRPLTVGGTTVRTLVVAPTDAAARAARTGTHTLVVRPLSSLTVSGLPASSPLFKTLNKTLSAKGIQIRAGFDDGAAGTEPDFITNLVPGSALGYFFGWGDYSYGGIGTTTYTTDDNTLVAFGHPMLYDGQVSGFLTNADTIGLWGSLDEPTKMLAPGAIRGAITVDSGAGIAGVVGNDAIPAKVPLISTAYNDATPAAPPVSTTTYVTPYAIDQLNDPFPDLNASAFYPAMFQAVGDQYYDGHLDYELTVDVTDGTHDYTITRDNQWEDTTGVDAAFFAISDIYGILNQLNTDPDGTVNAHITAITLVSHLSPQHVRARIADATVDRGLKIGSNTVHVSLYPYGSSTPVTKDVTLNIPKGTSLGGSLYVVSPDLGYEDSGGGAFFDDSGVGPTGPPQTLGDVVAQIEGQYANNDMLVAYDPQQGYGVDDYGYSSNLPWSSKATTPVVTDMSEFLTGGVEKDLAAFQMFAIPPRIVAGEPVMAVGLLNAMGIGDDSVQLYKREAGQTTDTLVATAPLVQQGSDDGSDTNSYLFQAVVANLRHNATITAVWAGNDQYLAASASTKVSVSPYIAFTVTKGAGGVLRFKASTSPASAGVIAFARVGAHGKRSLVKAVSETHGRASATWRAPAGTYRLVALFRGNALNTAGASRTITVTVP